MAGEPYFTGHAVHGVVQASPRHMQHSPRPVQHSPRPHADGLLVTDYDAALAAHKAPVRYQERARAGGTYAAGADAAAVKLQSAWRGHRARKDTAVLWRRELHRAGDDAPVPPIALGLPQYAEAHTGMPDVAESKRFGVRDITIQKVLLQLGCPPKYAAGRGVKYERVSSWWLSELQNQPALLPAGVQKQMKFTHLFVDPSPPPKPIKDPTDDYRKPKTSQYLLGQFDCLAVPVRADYDSAFDDILHTSSSSSQKGRRGRRAEPAAAAEVDCDGPEGFADWFYVLHAAAPNIGESAEADDFVDYSYPEERDEPVPVAGSAGTTVVAPPGRRMSAQCSWKLTRVVYRRLDEDLYISHMARLWRNCLMAMGRLQIDDAIFFPFGMGAFLRFLGQNDDRYEDEKKMRGLRRRIADELMNAIAELCFPPQAGRTPIGPRRVHLCLVCLNKESYANHNAFVHAAAEMQMKFPRFMDALQIRRNVDCLQLAVELTQASGKTSAMKVGILNGANRKLMGNHWFQHGARTAIDENLHRRSPSMARASLLVNLGIEESGARAGTEPCERTAKELSENLLFWRGQLGAQAESEVIQELHQPAVVAQPHATQQVVASTGQAAGQPQAAAAPGASGTTAAVSATTPAAGGHDVEAGKPAPAAKAKARGSFFACCACRKREKTAKPAKSATVHPADAAAVTHDKVTPLTPTASTTPPTTPSGKAQTGTPKAATATPAAAAVHGTLVS
eukprot:TRINITY_DN11035_c0_g1_i1.p1 TRINITY_DN11035_c0_g1~~TRINITY_DN11035_c0_g1_i1.p1  ORF type:complete len:734 (+),score=153.56 TRINITY_DN11035_c0_g1_i1:81-2282(+)